MDLHSLGLLLFLISSLLYGAYGQGRAPPQNVTAATLGPTYITVCFSPPPTNNQIAPITSFNITYVGMTFDTNPTNLTLLVANQPFPLTGLFCITLNGLQEYNNYTVIVVAVDTNGTGPSSSPITQITDQAVPSTPPINLRVFSLNSSSIQINWSPPELIDQNGVLIGYQVKYNGLELDTTVNVSSNTLSLTVTELLPNVNYCVMIRVENEAGFSGFSEFVCASTQQGGRAPPQNVTATTIGPTYITVCFSPPPTNYQIAPITTFNITYVGMTFDTNPVILTLLVTNQSFPLTGLFCITLNGLQEYNNYTVIVVAVDTNGTGPSSSPITQITDQAVPSTPPINLRVFSLNSSAIQINWSPPELIDQNGVLIGYQVKYNGLELDTTVNVSSNTLSLTVTELLPNVYYCVMIRVENEAGFSGFSESVCDSTQQGDAAEGINCTVSEFQLNPFTCELSISFSLVTPNVGIGMCVYSLLLNEFEQIHMVNSTPAHSNFSYSTSIVPRSNLSFSLSPIGCPGQSLLLCYQDTFPSYDFVNGSLNVTLAPETNIIEYSWKFMKFPSSASEHIIELKILSNQTLDFKFVGDETLQSTSRVTEYFVLSDQTNASEAFLNNEQVGMTLERLDVFVQYQIILQCGNNLTGEILTFNYSYTACTNDNCFVDTDMDGYPDQLYFCSFLNRTCRDNCPSNANPKQEDCDNNNIGDVCDNTCEPEIDGLFNFSWGCSKGGELVYVDCPDGMNTASRQCEQSGNWSSDIDTTNCVSSEYAGIMNFSSEEGLDVVLQVINKTDPTYAGDVIIIVNLLDTTIVATMVSNQSQVIVNKTVQIVSFLADSSQQQLLNQTQKTSGVAQRLLGVLETQARVLAVNRSLNVRLNESRNVFFETRRIIPNQLGDVVLTADNIKSGGQSPPSVNIPFQSMGGNVNMSVSLVVLRNIANLITSFNDLITLGGRGLKLSSFSQFKIVTPVVSVQIFSNQKLLTTNSDNTFVTLNLPLQLASINSQNYFRPTCLFLANATSSTPQWRDEGIRNVSSSDLSPDDVLTCNSGHSTAFVVLIGVSNLENQEIVLNIFSYFGCSVSIVCLMLSIAIYLIFGLKLLKKIYHFVHFQLSISLCLLYIAFLFGVELAYVDVWFYIPCKMVTVLVQYLLLVVFLWMLLEGVVVLIMMVWPFHLFTWKHSLVFFCVAWMLPLIYVIPFIPFFHHIYLSPPISNVSAGAEFCWLHSDENTHIIYSVTVPIALIILINVVIVAVVLVQFIILVVKQRSLSKLQRVQKTAIRLLRLTLVLFPVLGFGWTFGLLSLYFNRIAFAWIFTILCSFQGLAILIFVLLLRRDIQKSIVGSLNLKYHFFTLQSRLSSQSSKPAVTRESVDRKQTDVTIQKPEPVLKEPEPDLESPPSVIKVEEIENWRNKIEKLDSAIQPHMEIESLLFYEDGPRIAEVEAAGEENPEIM